MWRCVRRRGVGRRAVQYLGEHITYTQASPVRAASVAHCLGNRHAHSTHPRLPPPPSRLRASATAARCRTPPSPPTPPLALPSALPPPPPSPLPAANLPAVIVACTLAPAPASTACVSSSPSLSLSESTMTLLRRFRALPLPPPATLRPRRIACAPLAPHSPSTCHAVSVSSGQSLHLPSPRPNRR